MNAKNLRIGNLVYYKVEDELDERKVWNEINIIDAEDILFLEACETNKWNHPYSPIPLTEEELLKLEFDEFKMPITRSFVKKVDITYALSEQISLTRNSDKFGYWYVSFRQGYNIENERMHENTLVFLSNKLEYVHQLQNLYFVLTGKELKYKPTKK